MFTQNDVLRMVLADGSAIVRAGIKRLISDAPEIEVVDECADANSAIMAIAETHPDVVMLDFRLGSGTAVDVMRACQSLRPRPICIVHTDETDANLRAISYAAGADIFYDKNRDAAPLVSMLRKLAGALFDSNAMAVH